MGDLRVSVRFHGELVEDRVLPVDGAVRIGDSPGARVVFPGASLLVFRDGEALDVRGRHLREGERTGLSLGAVSVELEHLESASFRPRMKIPFDGRFLMLVVGMTVASMWVDLGSELLGRNASPPEALSDEARLASGADRGSAAVMTEDARPGEGREALPDDSRTRWGYYAWYRASVPPTVISTELARIRLAQSPSDTLLRAQVARGAYENENYREALHNYTELSEREPTNTRWLEGLGLAQKRLGQHRAEIATWDRLLQFEPDNYHAIGNLAIALARLGDYESAERELDRLRPGLASDPYLHVFPGMYQAIRGREVDAIAELEEAVSRRVSLSEAQQVELLRDLALDPVLGSLRADARLRAMLYRHFSAASPQPSL